MNQVLSPRDQFTLGIQECAKEFLGRLIDNINVTPGFFTRLHEEAVCPVCHHVSRRAIQLETNAILPVSLPEKHHPLDVADLVHARLSEPIHDMFCAASSSPRCHGLQIVGHIVQQVGKNSIVWICRNIGTAQKRLTPIKEPVSCQRLNGQSCVAVLAHCGLSAAAGRLCVCLPKARDGHLMCSYTFNRLT